MKDKCDSIRNSEPPKTVKDCRKFCGMVNFLATLFKRLTEIFGPHIQPYKEKYCI